jgi:hypothetical protein
MLQQERNLDWDLMFKKSIFYDWCTFVQVLVQNVIHTYILHTGFVVFLYYVQWYLRKWVFRYSVFVYCVLL